MQNQNISCHRRNMWMKKISVLYFVTIFGLSSSERTCTTCFESLGQQWCAADEKALNSSLFTRCLTNKEQQQSWEDWCGRESIYHPRNIVEITEDEPFSDPKRVGSNERLVQIKPQAMELNLMPGQPETLNISFKYVRGYSLQLYYLMDMSKSMEQDKKTITRMADDLATELQKLTPDLKLGFGSFLDKVMLPYVNTHSSWLENPCQEQGTMRTCRAPYGYQNILSLTNDTDQFRESVKNAKLSTNWDDPEGGLDALMQAMVCEDIGWEATGTRHLIVYVSSSAFKYAGDGKLAGLTKQNDMQCHLDEEGMYEYSSLQDYPSVSQIENISQDRRMHVIFAVKSQVLSLYAEVAKLITQSEASELREDSSNIIDIITNVYEDISRTLTLTDDSYKVPGLSVTYSSLCGDLHRWHEGSAQCEDVDVNEEIRFQLTFELAACMSRNEYSTVRISPQGLDDVLQVKVSSNCECDCEQDLASQENSKECTKRGTLACGVCICNKGYTGRFCECKDTISSLDPSKTDGCIREDDPDGRECSGHGVCKCGQCECQRGINGDPRKMYQGKYCECSNFDCPKNLGLLCSDHGRCECNTCRCDPGWMGSSCSCDQRRNNCIDAVSNKICSGHGDCECNQCRCHRLENDVTKRYFGKYCEDCQSCVGRCGSYNQCIQCKIFNNGVLVTGCDQQCSSLEIILVDKIEEKPNQKRCSYKDHDGCLIVSAYNPSLEKVVYVQTEPNCSGKIKLYVVIGSMVALVLLVGLLVLVVWKCWVTINDKREYDKFIREYEQANMTQTMNPIYRDPVTRVTNPLRGLED